MITFITGVPGTGKTCYLMTELLKARAEYRPIFQHGIPELVIEHEPIYCHAHSCKWCEENRPKDASVMYLKAEEWDIWAPTGALIVMDEVQNIYRPRGQGAKVPSSVAAFETHRHQGLDFFLLTQNPMLVDSNIRRLGGKHQHLTAGWAGRTMYEWDEVQENVKATSGAVKTGYKLDKSNFKLYKSSQLHTKINRRIPPAVYALGFIVVVIGLLGYRLFNRGVEVISGGNPEALPVAESTQSGDLTPSSASPFTPVSAIRPGGSPFDRNPLIDNFPESAPAYAELVEVVEYPRISGCMRSATRGTCDCYLQTYPATVAPVSYSYCLAYLDNPPFDPYTVQVTNGRSTVTANRSNLGTADRNRSESSQ